MPEGDTIFRAARTLDRALTGAAIVSFSTQIAAVAVVDRRATLVGRTVEAVAARGKHILMTLSGDLVLRTHMRMHGSWHIYRPGERWRMPRADARIVLAVEAWVAVAFRVYDADLLTADEIAHHARLSALGPDLLSEAPDLDEARRRIRMLGDVTIAEALLAQSAVAGIGNVFKSEVLFICGVRPDASLPSLSDEAITTLLTTAQRLMRLNVMEGTALAGGHGRVTSGRLNPAEKLWVYGRPGAPCLRCGTPIESTKDADARRTYWCPRCQVVS